MGSKCSSKCCGEQETEITLETFHEVREYEYNEKNVKRNEEKRSLLAKKIIESQDEASLILKLKENEANYGENHIKTAEGYRDLACFYYSRDNIVKSEEYLSKSFKIFLNLKEEKCADIAFLYNLKGILSKYFGHFKNSEGFYLKSIEIYEFLEGENTSINAVIPMNNLGILYVEIDQYNEAEKILLNALKIKEKFNNEYDAENFAFSYNNIGRLYEKKGNLKEAQNYYQKALKFIDDAYYGDKNNSETEIFYNNLANVTTNSSKKQDYYYKSHEILSAKVVGPSLSRSISYNNFGVCYMEQNDFEKAEEYLKKALDEKILVLGEKYVSVWLNYFNLGILYEKMGKFQQSQEFLEKGLKYCKETFGEKSANSAKIFAALGNLYKIQRKWEQAKANLWKAYLISYEILGENNCLTSYFWGNLI